MRTAVADLCQFGLTSVDSAGKPLPALKPTMFMSSSPAVLMKLDKRCQRRHSHQQLVDGRASKAALYPPRLCRAILLGIEAQRRSEAKWIPDYLQGELDKGCAIYSLDPEEKELIEAPPQEEHEAHGGSRGILQIGAVRSIGTSWTLS